jgi:hypothetical protein
MKIELHQMGFTAAYLLPFCVYGSVLALVYAPAGMIETLTNPCAFLKD